MVVIVVPSVMEPVGIPPSAGQLAMEVVATCIDLPTSAGTHVPSLGTVNVPPEQLAFLCTVVVAVQLAVATPHVHAVQPRSSMASPMKVCLLEKGSGQVWSPACQMHRPVSNPIGPRGAQ